MHVYMYTYIYISTYCQFIHGNAIIHGILLILANNSGRKWGEVINGSFFFQQWCPQPLLTMGVHLTNQFFNGDSKQHLI
jgi:hypothetical protein